MGYTLTARANAPAPHRARDWIKRFDASLWTVDFPRPAMASVVTTGPNALRVDAVFQHRHELIGLIWESRDRWSHPLLAYETARDFRRCRLSFRWRSGGVRALDAIHGPTLTIEGRDAAGAARSWYVRLWNYASGSPTDAQVNIDFGALNGGFLLPGEADPVWAGDIDRMFVSIVPPGYDPSPGALAVAAAGWVEMTEIGCDGSGSVLERGDAMLPANGLGIATGYDDAYNLTPARVVRDIVALGYRGQINHYVGMSHYFRLERVGDEHRVTLVGGALNQACEAWHKSFASEAKTAGLGVIWSLSYELFDAHCPDDWKQRAANGDPALTGWVPPSTLLSPAHGGAMGYLQAVARAFVGIALYAGLPVAFQVGEPWWWIMPADDLGSRRICLYDAATSAALGAASVPIATIDGAMTAAQKAMLDQAGALLAQSTLALADAARDAAAPGDCTTHLLVYLPTVLDTRAPEARRANVPVGWATPAFDILQCEDYDFVTEGRAGDTVRAIAEIEARLGYPPQQQHYLSGFVLRPEDALQWGRIDAAASTASAREVAACFIWALPQVNRDGYTRFAEGEDMRAFDDFEFPISIGREAEVTTEFSTAIIAAASGHEQRAPDWADARMRYDAGSGVRSEADLVTLSAFFRARHGPARSFRFRDPFDYRSSQAIDIAATDQRIGTGDGSTTRFELAKNYGSGPEPQRRRIARPNAASVRIALGGVGQSTGWSLEPMGVIAFATPPANGVAVTAGFEFDVAVRFAEDRLSVSRATFQAGEIASVPLIEVRDI